MNIGYLLTEQNVTISLPEKIVMFSKNQAEYAKAKELIKAEDEAGLISLVTNGMFDIPNWSQGKFKVDTQGRVLDIETDTLLDKVLAKRVISFSKEGLPFLPLLKFHRKVIENPNTESAQDLYRFLEKNSIAITQDGNFIAYKKVTRKADGSLVDTYSGKVPNEVGMRPTMERKLVDKDRRNQCSYGYHCCGWGYLSSFNGQVILEVEVDPRDVVAVPEDYSHTKMRVCSYLILCIRNEAGERTEKLVKVNKRSPDERVNSNESGMEELETDQTVVGDAPRIEGVDLTKMTAQDIKDYIKEKYNEEITIDNKNKQAIIKKANLIIFKV